MKILLVDDEQHILRAIQKLVDWEKAGIDMVLEATSGQQALELLKTRQPEILLTDVVMPDLTGLELIKTAHFHYPELKIILISGYDNFEYVHTAMLYGGVDYLLKPLDPLMLTSAIRRAVSLYEKERAIQAKECRSRKKIQQFSELAAGSLLGKFLVNSNSLQFHMELKSLIPSFADVHSGRVCVLDKSYIFQAAGDTGSTAELAEAMLKDSLSGERGGYWIDHPAFPAQRILFLPEETGEELALLEKTIQQINRYARLCVHLGVSEILPFPLCFRDAYEQAGTAFYHVLATRRPQALVYWSASMAAESVPDFTAKIQGIFSAILSNDRSYLKKSVLEWTKTAVTKEPTLFYLDKLLAALREQTGVWMRQLESDDPTLRLKRPESLSWTDISDRNGMFSAGCFAEGVFRRLEDIQEQLRGVPSDQRIRQVAQYLAANYQQPFSQSDCAALFCMSREYLCRLFSKEFGTSMVNYLNNIRVSHAKELLADPRLSIREIAHMVGFEDEKYFTRQFKKKEETTPAEYRQRLFPHHADY